MDNVSGANGVIAVNAAIASAPDGHTLLSVGGSLPINTVFRKFATDVRAGLAPVAQMSSQPYMMFLPASLPLGSFKEVMAYAQANPGKLSYGSSGVGSVVHMGMELIGFMSGVRMVHVPYKGNGPANVDLAAGRLDILLGSISGIQLVRTGKAKLVAVTSPQRLPDYPDIPTVAESGLGGYELSNTYTLYVPARTPGGIVAVLNQELIQSLGDQELRRKMVADASTPAPPRSPDELRKILVADVERWESLVKRAGITLED